MFTQGLFLPPRQHLKQSIILKIPINDCLLQPSPFYYYFYRSRIRIQLVQLPTKTQYQHYTKFRLQSYTNFHGSKPWDLHLNRHMQDCAVSQGTLISQKKTWGYIVLLCIEFRTHKWKYVFSTLLMGITANSQCLQPSGLAYCLSSQGTYPV